IQTRESRVYKGYIRRNINGNPFSYVARRTAESSEEARRCQSLCTPEACQCVGRKGIQGTPGPRGIEGPIGPTGYLGPIGPQGSKGEKGSPGTTGRQGLKGEIGLMGGNGYPGEDGQEVSGLKSLEHS
ncbi:unnamed protein product, partial [Protopolystoma xenopodis]